MAVILEAIQQPECWTLPRKEIAVSIGVGKGIGREIETCSKRAGGRHTQKRTNEKMKRILSTALCFLLVLPFPALATSIIVLLGVDSITIAADSALTSASFRGSECKIRCFHNLCFTASGRSNSPRIGYNVYELADKELRRHGSIEEVSERFRTVVEPIIPELVTAAAKQKSDRYAEWLKGLPVLEYLFVGFDAEGKPLGIKGDAMIDTEGRTLPVIESGKQLGESEPIGVIALGLNEHIDSFLKRDPMWRASAARDPSGFAERMVRIEIEASEKAGRGDASEPITVVRLTANGVSRERRGVCPEN
jgi:hypothetical protein